MRALEKQNLWQPSTDLRAWLFTPMHHHHVSDVRRAIRSPVANVSTAAEWHPRTPAEPQTGRLTLRDLQRELDRLPLDQRAALALVGLDGLSYDEVSAVLYVPIGTVESRISRARDTLRRRLNGSEADPVQAAA